MNHAVPPLRESIREQRIDGAQARESSCTGGSMFDGSIIERVRDKIPQDPGERSRNPIRASERNSKFPSRLPSVAFYSGRQRGSQGSSTVFERSPTE